MPKKYIDKIEIKIIPTTSLLFFMISIPGFNNFLSLFFISIYNPLLVNLFFFFHLLFQKMMRLSLLIQSLCYYTRRIRLGRFVHLSTNFLNFQGSYDIYVHRKLDYT